MTRCLCAAGFTTAALVAALPAEAQTDINITGATLFEKFFAAPASTSDYIDADGDNDRSGGQGLGFDQMTGLGYSSSATNHWNIQYHAVGSGNGLANLVNWWDASNPASSPSDVGVPSDDSYVNREAYYSKDASAYVNNYNPANPGGIPLPASGGTLTFDIAISDVPANWFVTNTAGTAKWSNAPGSAGYGNNAAVSVDGKSNTLKSLTPTISGGATLDLTSTGDGQVGSAGNAPTVYSTEIAWVPIAYIANHGTGIDQDFDGTADGNVSKAELQHLFVTGRMDNGENLVAVTRDSGSGTRNGAMNSLGVDPSWGVGENESFKNADKSYDVLGEDFESGNKGSSSRLDDTVRNHRLAVGYQGIIGKVDSGSQGEKYEVLGVDNDSDGAGYVRPNMTADGNNNVIFNSDPETGWQAGGSESMLTVGDPFAGDIDCDGNGTVGTMTFVNSEGATETVNAPWEYGNGNTETMQNVEAAKYIRNIVASIDGFVADPGAEDLIGTPGEYLALNFALVKAVDALPDASDPSSFVAGSPVAKLQEYQNLPTATIETTWGQDSYGQVSHRKSGVTYSDGNTGDHYKTADGLTTLDYGTVMASSGASADLQRAYDRNAIAGDFDGDGSRTKDDIDALVKAYQNNASRSAWVARSGAHADDDKAVFELLGDFDGDGNFTIEDVRYFADGLGAAGRAGNKLHRKLNFIDVDVAAGGNLFGTSLATGKTYVVGDSRGDIAGNIVSKGWAPTGADGVVNAQDIDYVFAQFVGMDQDSTGGMEWANLDEASMFDLSADMTGDLVVNQSDIDELVTVILGTTFGDMNLDGATDTADFTVWRNSFLSATPLSGWANGDVNGDGAIDTADFTLWRNAFLAPAGAGHGLDEELASADWVTIDRIVSTPEPASLVLLGLGGAAVLLRRRK